MDPAAENQQTKNERRFTAWTVVVAVSVSLVIGGLLGFAAHRGLNEAAVEAAVMARQSLTPVVQLELGETGVIQPGGEVTVYSWGYGAPDWAEPAGDRELTRALVKYCLSPAKYNFRAREIPYLFNLVDANGGPLIDPFVDYKANLEEFASYNTALLSPGDCISGSIIFPLEAGQRPVAVRFSGRSRFDWDVSDIPVGAPASPPPSATYSPGLSAPP